MFSFNPPQEKRGYRLTILVDAPDAWILPWARKLRDAAAPFHDVRLVRGYEECAGGDIAFLLGCTSIAPKEMLAGYRCNVVVHESDLPRGRGWSPVAWQVLEGRDEIPVCLFEAVERVDAGRVFLRDVIALNGAELLPEIRDKQGLATVRLCLRFLELWPDLEGEEQTGAATFYRKRTRDDDRLPVDRPLEEIFDRLRVVDNERYPAWFALRGRRYALSIRPMDEDGGGSPSQGRDGLNDPMNKER